MTVDGGYIWYELLTSDVEAAGRFYGDVVGWKLKGHGTVPGYHQFAAGETDIGGMMAMPREAGILRPLWLGYIHVADVDATVTAILKDGGAQCVPPTDIPGVGRFAMVRDAQGVATYVMSPSMQGVSQSFAAEPGHCQWNELVTTDPVAAADFYTRHFGWRKGDVMSMGPLGDYQFLLAGEQRLGAVMKRTQPGASPLWRFYFGVDDIDRGARAIASGGGRLLGDLQQVPGGGYAAVAIDPQGAEFGIAGPRKV
jgi:predicted enzyme related to lactoylglutathione lyase